MIQKIVKNSDIKFCVSDDSKIQDKFIIKFYTIDKSKAITRTADDVITDNEKRYIKLNWSTIKLLDNGMLNYEVNNLDSDADYDDGVYNSTFTRTTYYYLCTDSDGLVDAVEEIELRVDKITTDITKEKEDRIKGDSKLTEDINYEIARAKEEDKNIRSLLDYSLSLISDNEYYIEGLQTKITGHNTKITDLQTRLSALEAKFNTHFPE